MKRKSMTTEIRWFLICFIAIVFVGSSFDLGLEAGLSTLIAYLVWHHLQLKRLEDWVYKARSGKIERNEMLGVVGEIAEDVALMHQRHAKEKARLQSVVSRVQEMTAALTDGVVLADAKGNLEWWNNAATTMLGLKEMDLGHPLTNIVRDPKFQNYFDKGTYDEPLEMESFRNHGLRLLFEVHPYGHGERLITVRDVTRVAKLEQMRRDFVANVSHELRTPLTVIRGYVETLIDMPLANPTLKRALAQMDQQGLRMTSLVNDLIVLTKLETDDRNTQGDEVKLRQLVDLIFNDGRALSDKAHNYVNEVDESLVLRGNEKELRSAISNLVINAVKYASNDPDKPARIRVYSKTLNNSVCLSVEDNGVGIDSKHIPRLTERFYRIDAGRSSSAGGTGLGLAIVKHVLIRHDAILRISSKLGRGSTFTCEFPTDRVVSQAKSA